MSPHLEHTLSPCVEPPLHSKRNQRKKEKRMKEERKMKIYLCHVLQSWSFGLMIQSPATTEGYEWLMRRLV
jgi:hypothetical protein